MVRGSASGEEPKAAYKLLSSAILAGILMVIAQPLTTFIVPNAFNAVTTSTLTDSTGGTTTTVIAIPTALTGIVDSIFTLLRYIGAVVIVGGLLYAAIELRERVAKDPEL